MKEFYGTYRGFSPTDESNICIGELEVTLSDEGLRARFATGLYVQDEFNATHFSPMSPEEIEGEYKQGSPYVERTLGFRAKDGLPKLLFLQDPQDNEYGLVMRVGEMREILGPTLLFSPAQVSSGAFDRFLKGIEEYAGRGVFPRLANDGKA
jgi:hypothetical protein